MQLTKTQKLSIEASGKNILVSAGAGTGKTHVLVERFLYHVTLGKIPVTEILALTFTDKAANEMKSRIYKRLGEMGLDLARRELESAYISTIHAFATRLLREHPIEASVDPGFRVMEQEESDFIKEQVLDEVFERHCQAGSEGFELLRVYGEPQIRKGLLTILEAVRQEGKTLTGDQVPLPKVPGSGDSDADNKGNEPGTFGRGTHSLFGRGTHSLNLFEKLDEPELTKEWRQFSNCTDWTWELVEDFKAWKSPFSRRGGKNQKAEWAKVKKKCDEFLLSRIEEFSIPWRAKIEKLALVFESLYELRKKEESSLDFEDLQIKALGLFKKPGMVHQKLLDRYRKRFQLILVDEFQDTNPLQLELIEILSSGQNLFLVGDYKQSIYAFRGAEPKVFLAKEREYEKGDSGVRIPLLENFRTEEPLLKFLNCFFRNLWQENNLPFEDLAAQVEGTDRTSVELLKITQQADESLDHARLREASAIAQRIRTLYEDEKIPYGDIAILFQAMTSEPIYEQALKKEGIPYFVIAGRGFYHQPEIRDMMSFLGHLENPLSDIPLAATLRSPFFQVKDDTLVWLAHYAKKENEWNALYEGIKQFEAIPEIPDTEKEKLKAYREVTCGLLLEKDKLRLAELLEKILAKTSYELTALAHPQGSRRYANLKKLLSLAREYESRELMGIGSFLRLIRRLATQEIKESEAQVEAEKSGRAVRLLTIHRAKGLEFPAVFVADLAHKPRGGEYGSVTAQAGKGYAMKVFNEKSWEWEKPFSWREIEEEIRRKENDEWKRLFYVAATRAKSKLILSGVYKERKTEKESYDEMSSWMEWIVKTPPEILQGMEIREEKGGAPRKPRLPLAEKKIFQEALVNPGLSPQTVSPEVQNVLARLAQKEKGFSKIIDLPVSAYAAYQKGSQVYHETYEIGYPDWMAEHGHDPLLRREEENEENLTPADFGTTMHRVLERLDFKNPERHSAQLVKECFRGAAEVIVSEAQEMVKKFLETSLFQRLARAKILKRELPFLLNERHGMIHGVIDLLFQDPDGTWHVVDYKAAVGSPEKVKEAGYDLQIQMYALAVSELLKEVPRSGILYFLKNQWEYRVDFNAKRLQEAGERLRELQDEIIAFRNQNVECTLAGESHVL